MDAPKIMSLHSIKEITHDFSPEQELGSGKYGTVYKGVQNGVEIAVKMLQFTPGVDDCEQFKKEFENLRKLRHRNIVQLLGYCYEIKREYVDSGNGRFVFADCIYRALSFEYMHKGSLREYISEEFDGLDWQTRYKIIKGVSEGLKYLHDEVENSIYHLDLKPENILLDKNMMPKLADFGLSRLVVNEQTRATESPVGTIGYIPPEYIEDKLISKKFDIFSLGVVMIKIMAGHEGYNKKADMSSQEFINLVHKKWRNRLQVTPGCTPLELEDACNQVKRCIEIASECVRTDRKQRPEIGTIVHWLNETELMIKKMVLCLPPESSNDQRQHIEEAQPMDMSTAPSPLERTNIPTGVGLEETSSAEVIYYNNNSLLRRAHLSGSNPGVQLTQLLGSNPGVVNPLQKMQPGGDTSRRRPKDVGGNGKGQKDGARNSGGGEGGGKNTETVPPHPTWQQLQQLQMKGMKPPPPLPQPPLHDNFFNYLFDPPKFFYDYPEMVLEPMAMLPGANGGGKKGQPKDASGNGKGQKDGACCSCGGEEGGGRDTNMVVPMQMKGLKLPPPSPAPLPPPPQPQLTFPEYEDDDSTFPEYEDASESDDESIPDLHDDDPWVVLEPKQAMPPDANRGDKNGGNVVGSKKGSGRKKTASKGNGNNGSKKTRGGMKQNNDNVGGGLPRIRSIIVRDPREGMLPQQEDMARPTGITTTDGTEQIGSNSISGMPPQQMTMTHLHFHMGDAAGLEMLQAAAATGNPMAQQQYMALMQWQLQQQQMITDGHAHGHGDDGAARRRRRPPFSCVLSCFCCA